MKSTISKSSISDDISDENIKLKYIKHIAYNRGTLELGHMIRSAIDNGLFDSISDKQLNDIKEILETNQEILIFKWASMQEKPPERYQESIDLIYKYFTKNNTNNIK